MYAVFVITAILLSVAPMHAHALLATVLPGGVPARQAEVARHGTVRDPAPAPRLPARTAPIPAHLAQDFVLPASSPAPRPVVMAVAAKDAAAPLAHAPNAP